MLGQRDFCVQTSSTNDFEEGWKRNVWDDLLFAIQLLKKFDDELSKLHPDVRHRIRQLMI